LHLITGGRTSPENNGRPESAQKQPTANKLFSGKNHLIIRITGRRIELGGAQKGAGRHDTLRGKSKKPKGRSTEGPKNK